MPMYKYWWIKERYNPQLGTYYIKYGNTLTVKQAKAMEDNTPLPTVDERIVYTE